MRYLHDYTRASLETGSIPNDAAAPVVFADMAAILQCIEPRQDSPHGLRVEVMQTIQELLSKGTKGRHIKEPTKPKGLRLAMPWGWRWLRDRSAPKFRDQYAREGETISHLI